MNTSIVKLNVGGERFTTRYCTLVPEEGVGHFFEERLSGQSDDLDENGCHFVDRSPEYFKVILEFLRSGELDLQGTTVKWGRLLREAGYYGYAELITDHVSSTAGPLTTELWQEEFVDNFASDHSKLIEAAVSGLRDAVLSGQLVVFARRSMVPFSPKKTTEWCFDPDPKTQGDARNYVIADKCSPAALCQFLRARYGFVCSPVSASGVYYSPPPPRDGRVSIHTAGDSVLHFKDATQPNGAWFNEF